MTHAADLTTAPHEADAVSVLVCPVCWQFVTQDRHDDATITWLHEEGGIGPQIRDRALVDAIEAIGNLRVTLKP